MQAIPVTTAPRVMMPASVSRYEHPRPISRRSHPAPLPLLPAPTLPLRLLLPWDLEGAVNVQPEPDLYQHLREQCPKARYCETVDIRVGIRESPSAGVGGRTALHSTSYGRPPA
jgi:hypothetical protein